MAGRVRWRVQGLHRNERLARLVERKIREAPGFERAEASPLTGRLLTIFAPALSLDHVREVVETSLAAARSEARLRCARRVALPDAGNQEVDLAKAEREANLDLAVSLVSLGFATLGLVWPPFAVAGIVGFLYVVFPIFRSATKALWTWRVNLDTLVSITAIGGLLSGHFWILCYASVIYPLSRKLVLAIQDHSRRQLIDVFQERPSKVWIVVQSGELEVPIEDLRPGHIVVVCTNELVPADGVVVDGAAPVDQHVLTGESQPIDKTIGDEVLAATRVVSGRILIEVQAVGPQTAVGRIGEILNRTADYRSVAQLRAEVFAEQTVAPTVGLAGIALPLVGPRASLGVMNAHFRHKVTALAPVATLSFLNIASRQGILIKDGRTLDRLNDVDTIVFDKTGTLTEEDPVIGRIFPFGSHDEEELLGAAAAAEQAQSHPFARAIFKEVQRRKIIVPAAESEECSIGLGLAAKVSGTTVRIGSLRFMEDFAGLAISREARENWHSSVDAGNSVSLVAIGSEVAGGIELLPTLRAEAAHLVRALRKRSRIRSIHIISGDHPAATRRIAEDLGVDSYFAETLPENKAQIVDELQGQGRRVCYIGDGINDSIALKKSHVSVSLTGACAAARDTAEIVLMDGSLRRLPNLFDIGQDFVTTMNRTIGIIVAPTVIGMLMAFFSTFGLTETVILSEIAFGGGILSAIYPRVAYRR
jgi:Cu2+-exporting ATPase